MLFLIIFGTRGVTYSHKSGQFHCPNCAQPRGYQHKRVRRFFTLYFIPLIPLDLIGEYIECDGCRGTYKEAVLSLPPAPAASANAGRQEAQFQEAIKRIMVLMMLADGVVHEAELQTICDIYSKISGRPIDRYEIEQEVAHARADHQGVQEYLGSMAGSLNDSGKEMVVKAAYFVAMADGVLDAREKALLEQIGQTLRMTHGHFQGVLGGLQRGGN